MHCHFHFPKMQRKRNSWLIHLETDAKLRDRKSFKENRKPEAGSCYFVFIHLVQMAVTRAKIFLLKKLSPLSLPDNGFFFFLFDIFRGSGWLNGGWELVKNISVTSRVTKDAFLTISWDVWSAKLAENWKMGWNLNWYWAGKSPNILSITEIPVTQSWSSISFSRLTHRILFDFNLILVWRN